MIMYKCLKCRKEIKPDEVRDKIRCPYCGYRILIKLRSKTVRKVEVR